MVKKYSTGISDVEKKEMNFSMRLSFLVGILILVLKAYAYYLTESAAILSDTAEQVIHVLAVGFATYSMWLSLKPPDSNHPYGHEKIGFFSAGFEGAMIIVAAIYIFYNSTLRLINGSEVQNVDAGLFFTLIVIAINFTLSIYLIRKGKKHKSIVLEANGKHILTDCWTSFAVILALVLVKLTNKPIFDPLIAILAAINILWTGSKLVKRSIDGLMDQADTSLQRHINYVLKKETSQRNVEFDSLRHRQSGNKIFVEFHVLFPTDIKLTKAHDIASEIETALRNSLDTASDIITHLEPQHDH